MGWSEDLLAERLKANPHLKVAQPRMVKQMDGWPEDENGKRTRKAVGESKPVPQPKPQAKPEKPQESKPRKTWDYESRLAQQLEDAGIQGFFVDAEYIEGRGLRGDIVFPMEGRKLIVEIQGAVHRIKAKWASDIRKVQDTMLAGYRLLPIATDQVRDGSAVEIIKRALGIEIEEV